MKILHISKFYAPIEGGLESVVRELVEGLSDAGHQTDVLCANTASSTDVSRAPRGYTITRTSSLGKLMSTSISPAMLMHTQRLARKYDVIHVHLPDPMSNLALSLARPTSKIVVHWHSDIVKQQRALKLYAPLQRMLLRRADAIIATSSSYAESSPWLQEFADKVNIIPIGIQDPYKDLTTSPQKIHSIRRQYGERRIVFALGRMTYYKGFDVLIDAAKYFPSDVVILIGGAGELLETYRKRVALNGLQDKIHFLGRVDNELLPALFLASDIFCLPSTVRSEAFGVVMLEAMAAAKPIVACDIPGSGVSWVNQHGETGLNSPSGDARALATNIQRILDNPELAERFGVAARKRFELEFTGENMVNKTLDLYRKLRRYPALSTTDYESQFKFGLATTPTYLQLNPW
jgi:rhamnosyl/mannosyltransferase